MKPVLEASDVAVIQEGKTIGIIAYLTLVGLVAALIMNSNKNNEYEIFYILLSLGFMVTGFAIMFVSWVPFIGWLFGVVVFSSLLFLWFTRLFNALNGKEKVVLVLGSKYAEWFK